VSVLPPPFRPPSYFAVIYNVAIKHYITLFTLTFTMRQVCFTVLRCLNHLYFGL
jgi:hypothetical protein